MFGFSPEERKAVIFFSAVMLIGAGVNFFAKTNSGMKILPLIKEEAAKISLNRADKDLLMSIPGIGEKLSSRILDYRLQHGGFRDLEELKNIKGLRKATYEKIKDSLSIR